MSSYLYKRSQWLAFRAKCLRRAGYVCERCKRGDVVLQIHHDHYAPGRLPWQYPVEFCEVVCRRCHAEIHGIIKPSGGWAIICSDLDNNEPSDPIPCENCGLDVTWHFTVYHPTWGVIVVGSECAENLSLGPEIKKLKSHQRRLETFIVSPRWKETPKGCRINYQGYDVLVYRSKDKFRLKINDDWGERNYDTLEAAKTQAFVRIDHLLTKHAE